MYMLASDNLGQAFRRMGYFKNLSNMMKTEAQNIRSMQEELEVQKAELVLLKREAEQLKKTRVKDLEDLRQDEKKADAVVKKLQKDKKKPKFIPKPKLSQVMHSRNAQPSQA